MKKNKKTSKQKMSAKNNAAKRNKRAKKKASEKHLRRSALDALREKEERKYNEYMQKILEARMKDMG